MMKLRLMLIFVCVHGLYAKNTNTHDMKQCVGRVQHIQQLKQCIELVRAIQYGVEELNLRYETLKYTLIRIEHAKQIQKYNKNVLYNVQADIAPQIMCKNK